MLTRNEPQPSRELTPALDETVVWHAGPHGTGSQWADTGDGREPTAGVVRAMLGHDLPLELGDALIYGSAKVDQFAQQRLDQGW